MADEPLAPMTDWRERVWVKYDVVVPAHWSISETGLISIEPCYVIPCPPFSSDHDDTD